MHLFAVKTGEGIYMFKIEYLIRKDTANIHVLVGCIIFKDFPGYLVVKNLPTMQDTGIQSLDWEDPLEKRMTTHSSMLAWKIPWTKEPGGLQSMGFILKEYVENWKKKKKKRHIANSLTSNNSVCSMRNHVGALCIRYLWFTKHILLCIDWNSGDLICLC